MAYRCETCNRIGDDVREYRRPADGRAAFGCIDDRACFNRYVYARKNTEPAN